MILNRSGKLVWMLSTVISLCVCLTSISAAAELRVFSNWREDHAQQLEEFLNSRFPNDTITIQFKQTSATTRDDILNGNYDLVFLPSAHAYAQDALTPLDPWIARDGLTEEDVKGSLSSIRKDGHIYDLPVFLSPKFVIYNKDLFDEHGVAYPSPEWTWSDLKDKARLLTETNDQGDPSVWGLISAYPGSAALWNDMVNQTGDTLFDATDDIFVETFNQWTDMVVGDGSVYDNSPQNKPRSAIGGSMWLFRQGKAALQLTDMSRTFDWAIRDPLARKIHWDIVPLPGLRSKPDFNPVAFVYTVGVTSDSSAPGAAWKVAKFIAGAETSGFLASLGGYFPASLSGEEFASWYEAAKSAMDYFPDGVRTIVDRPLFMPNAPVWPLLKQLVDLTPKMMDGDISRQNVLQVLKDKRNKLAETK